MPHWLHTAAAMVITALCIWIVHFLNRAWRWRRKIDNIMAEQGIKGPSYNLLDGNYREMKKMQVEASRNDMPTITHDIVPRVFPFLHKNTQLYGERFLHWWGLDPIIHVTQPEHIVEVFSLKFGHYQKSSQIRRAMKFLFGQGLLVAIGEEWVHQRHVVNSALSMEKIKCFVPLIIDCVRSLASKWELAIQSRSGEQDFVEIEVKQDLVDMATEMILKCTFSDDYERAKKYPELVYSLLNLNAKSSPFNHFLPSFKKQRLLKQIETCFQQVVQDALEKPDRGDILGWLLSANRNLTVQQVVDECKNIVFAGHETTAHMLTWTMMLLAIHPEWQDKAFKEVQQVCGDDPPTVDMLSKLKIMNMIFHESLRLYPPGAQTAREALKDMKLGDEIFVPKGVSLAINIVEVHRNFKMWGEDALEFKPQRFSEGVSKACKHPVGGYIPFLLGPRVCVGQGFAMLEAKIAMTIILQRLFWQVSPNYRHSPVVALTLQPQHGMQLLLSPRRGTS